MKKFLLVIFILLVFSTGNVEARQGCCSHHDGVSHCDTSIGYYICKDGTRSKTCQCEKQVQVIRGCTDPAAKNYNPSANTSDNSCTYYTKGCTDKEAINYDSNAEIDDGTCEQKVLGCMDQNAINYNSSANTDDGSCKYEETDEVINEDDKTEKLETKKQDSNSDTTGLGIFMTLWASICGVSVYKTLKKKR